MGVFSFGTYKNINGWYGGAIVSPRRELIEQCRAEMAELPCFPATILLKRIIKAAITDLVTTPLLFKLITSKIFRYGYLNDIAWINRKVEIELDLSLKDHLPPHYLTRLTPAQAKLILHQMATVDSKSAQRIHKAKTYQQELKGINGLMMADGEIKGMANIYTYYPIQYEQRTRLLKYLMLNHCDVAAQHLKNCADLPAFSAFQRDCPNARKTAASVIILPTYPRYAEEQVQKNATVIQSFFAQN